MKHVVLTLGPLGAALCALAPDLRSMAVRHLPAAPAMVLSSSGAGDCLVAGCLLALLDGKQPLPALACGLVSACCTQLRHLALALGCDRLASRMLPDLHVSCAV